MALSNYADIRMSVINWLNDPAKMPLVPDFIRMAEGKINRKLRVSGMERTEQATLTAGVNNITLPTNYINMRRLQVNTNPATVLEQVTPEFLADQYTGSGLPKAFTVIDSALYFGPTPDSAYTVQMVFYRAFDALNDSTNTTNWITANAPDLLIYGALAEATQTEEWHARFNKLIAEINDAEGKYKQSGLRIRPA